MTNQFVKWPINSDFGWPFCPSNLKLFHTLKADTKFIDVAIPDDSRVSQKSVEKRDRYHDLSVIVSRLWNTSTSVVLVIVGALGSILTDLHQSLTSIGLTSSVFPIMQKPVLLSTSRILRHYLF